MSPNTHHLAQRVIHATVVLDLKTTASPPIGEPLRAAPTVVTMRPARVTRAAPASGGLNRPVGRASSVRSVGRSRPSTVRSVFLIFQFRLHFRKFT
jgi:hypothetical protein